jgi:LEA14-like dessication related protein
MTKRLRALSAILIIFILGSAISCSHMRHLLGVVADKPEVRLVNVDVRSMSMKRMEMDFVLEVLNPNSFSVDIEELRYNVRSLDLDLGEGEHKDRITLKSHEKAEVRLPFRIDPDMLVNLMKKYLQNPKELKVQLKATLYLGTAIGKLDMVFEEEKTIMRGFAPTN